jgi:transposase
LKSKRRSDHGHGRAVGSVRAKEAKQLYARGPQPFLTRTRWLRLERPENLAPKQEIGLGELLLRSNPRSVRADLLSVRADLLEEDLQRFWSYVSPNWAVVFLDRWCTRVMGSRLEPMKKVARMLHSHRELILSGAES